MTTHVLNFQARFAELVASGAKRQTIRAPRKRPIAMGDTLRLYTGLRQKGARLLGEGRVTAVAWPYRIPAAVRRGRQTRKLYAMAIADGFESGPEMCAWFQKVHGLPFDGVLIQWELIR